MTTAPYLRYLAAERALDRGLIRLERSLARADAPCLDPEARMSAMRSFLGALGDPQRGIPAVHVAGTSGKGSVAAAVASILGRAGLRVGLHLSPYIQAATEKIAVGERFIAAEDFANLVGWVLPVAEPLVSPEAPASIHGMASVAVALEAFRRAAVDVVVCEVGCGGRFDLTAFVETAVAVVTNVGLDHVGALGPGIERIAWHKAGVARPGRPLVTGASGAAARVVREEAVRVGAPLVEIPPLSSPLDHNRAIAAAAAAEAARALGVPLGSAIIDEGLARVRLPGRGELMPGDGPRVILDGAHNPDKLAVAAAEAFAKPRSGPRVGVVGVLRTKASADLLAPLSVHLDHAVATAPATYGKPVCTAEETRRLLADLGCPAEAVADPEAALDRALERAGAGGTVLVTGSFYLLGAVRERWFPKEAVVLQRTSWPQARLEK